MLSGINIAPKCYPETLNIILAKLNNLPKPSYIKHIENVRLVPGSYEVCDTERLLILLSKFFFFTSANP